MKKELIMILIISFILILSYFFSERFDIFHTLPIVELKDNLTAIHNRKVTDISYIRNIRYGKIVSKEKNIDTKTLGKKKVTIKIENNYGKKKEYIFYIEVIKPEK